MKYALILSVLLNGILLWKVGSDSSEPTSRAASSSFTPDHPEELGMSREDRKTSASKLLSHASSNSSPRKDQELSSEGAPPATPEISAKPDDTLERWDEKVSSALTNDFRMSSATYDRYRRLKQSYQQEISEYVPAKSTPGAEYFVPTLDDQRELIKLKDRYSHQIRQVFGDENFASYQKMLREFNAANTRPQSSGRSPTTEISMIEF